MALIKSHLAAPLTHDAIVLDLGDLSRQAAEIKARARAEADQILADARAEVDRCRVEAAERGRAEGLVAGHAEGLKAGRAEGLAAAQAEHAEQLQAIATQWTSTVERWEADYRQMTLDARRSLLQLALAMTQKIVRRVPKLDSTVVVDQVACAIDHVTRPCQIAVCVHPEDRALIESALPSLTERLGGTEHVKLEEDSGIERGGCVLRHGQGRIDATLQTQLDRITEALLPDDQEKSA